MRSINHIKLNFFLLIIFQFSFGHNKYTISGIISEEENNEALIGAIVHVPKLNIITTTNSYGFYSLTFPECSDTIEVIVQNIGHSSVKNKIVHRK